LPAPVSVERQRELESRYSRGPTDFDRFIGEEEAAWRRGVSLDAFRVEQKKSGKPRRFQMTDRRHAYRLREVLQIDD
jgi:hypothetical protein